MSSYVVNDRTINRIICNISRTEYAKIFGDLHLQKAGEKMFDLNVKAVRRDYPEDKCEYEEFSYFFESANPMQRYKSLRCYLYNTSSMDHTDLYIALTKLSENYANMIIQSMPEYEKAEWN